MDLSIVVPVYNEEKRIISGLKRIKEYFSKSNLIFEIVVVNDGSTDKTKEKIIGWRKDNPVNLVSYEKNRGKGYAVRKGVMSASGRTILITDADISTPLSEYPKLKKAFDEGNPICIGSRRLKGSNIRKKQPIHREILGRGFNLLIRVFLFGGILDTQCGFKLFNAKACKNIFSKCKMNGFSYDVEVIYIAKKMHIKIKEVPVVWIDSPKDSKVNIFSDTFRMLIDIIKIRLIH